MSGVTNLPTFFEGKARREQVELPEGYGYKGDAGLGVGFYICGRTQVNVLEKPICIPNGKNLNQGYIVLFAYCQKQGIVSLLEGGMPPRMLATQKEPSEFESLAEIADNFGAKEPQKSTENSKYCVALRVPVELAQQAALANRDIWVVQFALDAVSPFLQAAKEGDADKVQKGLDAGLDANAVDEDGVSALQMAAFNGSLDTVKALVAMGANVNYAEPFNARTALMFAAQGGFADVVSFLLDSGADHAKADSEDQTPLAWAAVAGKADVASVLRGAGSSDPKALEISKAIGHTATTAVLES